MDMTAAIIALVVLALVALRVAHKADCLRERVRELNVELNMEKADRRAAQDKVRELQWQITAVREALEGSE